VQVIKSFKEIGRVIEPEDTLEVGVGQSRLLVLKVTPRRMVLSGGDKVASWTNLGPPQFSLAGVSAGTATWYLWFGDPGKDEQILALRIRVLGPEQREGEKAPRSKRFNQFVQQIIDPQEILTFQKGESRVMVLKEAPFRIQMSEATIANYSVVNTPTVLNVEAKQPGTTVMTFWMGDKEDVTKQSVFSFVIHVKR
jgi:Flp pilus assembly secretin CpaC